MAPLRWILPAALAVLIASLASCVGTEPARPRPQLPLPLTVLSYNIRYANPGDGPDRWENRRERVAELIAGYEPDVVGLQEALAGQLEDLSGLLPGYGRVGVGRDDGEAKGEFAAILFRLERLELLESGNFWFSDTPEVPGSKSWGNRVVRICTWARLRDRGSGREFRIYNVHLDHESQRSRLRSAELLTSRIRSRGDGLPVIVTGDFNAGESNPAIAVMTAPSGAGLADSFRLAHPGETRVGTFNNFGKPGGAAEKIDYIFVPPGTRVRDAGIDRRSHNGRFPSDHHAVWARIELE